MEGGNLNVWCIQIHLHNFLTCLNSNRERSTYNMKLCICTCTISKFYWQKISLRCDRQPAPGAVIMYTCMNMHFSEACHKYVTLCVEKFYVYNIFTTNYRWLVVIGYNLNLPLKWLFCPTNNNLPLRICCENVVDIAFLLYVCICPFVSMENKWITTLII